MVKALTGEAPTTDFSLFVEGAGPQYRDQHVLTQLLDDLKISIYSMGPARNLKNAAEAFSADYNESNRKMMFLIDRDHRGSELVEKSWSTFLDPDSANLIIWRKRQLENYFLDPAYLAKSKYLKTGWTEERLGREIQKLAAKRLYLDAANLVIIRIGDGLREEWIENFKNPSGFETYEKALRQILSRQEFSEHEQKVCGQLREDYIKTSFAKAVKEFMGSGGTLVHGRGHWKDLIDGKPLLNEIISQGFKLKDAKGKSVQGEEKFRKVLEDLLSLPLEDQPEDFQELHRLIAAKVQSG